MTLRKPSKYRLMVLHQSIIPLKWRMDRPACPVYTVWRILPGGGCGASMIQLSFSLKEKGHKVVLTGRYEAEVTRTTTQESLTKLLNEF